jgi:hypothetical protein
VCGQILADYVPLQSLCSQLTVDGSHRLTVAGYQRTAENAAGLQQNVSNEVCCWLIACFLLTVVCLQLLQQRMHHYETCL